jgi:hypothetical protein
VIGKYPINPITSTPCDYPDLKNIILDITTSINELGNPNANVDEWQYKVPFCLKLKYFIFNFNFR